MNITQENIDTAALTFLVFGGLITFLGSVFVYLVKRPKKRK